jgi:hypothetical protein
MANSQHKYLLERGWSQQQIDEVIRKAHEWLRGAGYTPLTEQGHWNGIMGSTQSYHLPSREKDARGMTEAFVEMLKGGKILDASRVHKFSRPGEKDMMAKTESFTVRQKGGSSVTYKTDPLTAESLRRLWKLAIDSGASVPQGFNAMLALGINTGKILRASRPGAKATFKVEDRFYFGKGRKERFADDRLAKFLDVYNRNEDNNYHSENVVLLAKFLGSTDDVAQAQRIANEQRRSSDGISEKLYKERTELNRRLLSKFRSRYPQADI